MVSFLKERKTKQKNSHWKQNLHPCISFHSTILLLLSHKVSWGMEQAENAKTKKRYITLSFCQRLWRRKGKKFVGKNEGFKLNDANFRGKSYPFLKTYNVFMIYIVLKDFLTIFQDLYRVLINLHRFLRFTYFLTNWHRF